jgi:DNA-binding response OmpR family regulator
MHNHGVVIKERSVVTEVPPLRQHIAKIFVVCDQRDTAPVWGYMLRQQGLNVILETSLEKAIDRWSSEITDLIVLDINVTHEKRMESYKAFRALSVIPLIMILPAYHENEILEAYNAGVDDVVIKPISPPVFMAKVLAWIRRSWTMPVGSLSLQTGSVPPVYDRLGWHRSEIDQP